MGSFSLQELTVPEYLCAAGQGGSSTAWQWADLLSLLRGLSTALLLRWHFPCPRPSAFLPLALGPAQTWWWLLGPWHPTVLQPRLTGGRMGLLGAAGSKQEELVDTCQGEPFAGPCAWCLPWCPSKGKAIVFWWLQGCSRAIRTPPEFPAAATKGHRVNSCL